MFVQRMSLSVLIFNSLSIMAYAQTEAEIPKAIPSVPFCQPGTQSSIMDNNSSCVSVSSTAPKPSKKKVLPNMFVKPEPSNTNVGGNVIMDEREENKLKPPKERVLGAEVQFGIKTK